MRYCTLHYWIARGGGHPDGLALGEYVARSGNFGSVVSMPARGATGFIGGDAPLSMLRACGPRRRAAQPVTPKMATGVPKS
ncbi:MAG: hypothetical protein JRN24_03795, partial [Nitrososphaerota archaeon]|nr:hypothetical protein [Nitrososphaerota archaeon]